MQTRFPAFLLLVMLVLSSFRVQAQAPMMVTPDTAFKIALRPARTWLVAGTHAAVWAGTYIALNKAWYADYPKQSFHTFNDWPEWQQMDKAGHVWTAYTLGRYSTELWRWTGMADKNAIWLGGASALAYQSIIEIQDGFSAEWGFSWGDMAANALGAGAFVAQELGWKEQRIQIKFNYNPYRYPPEVEQRSRDLFGSGTAERMLKDYNSQTYWLSARMHAFLPQTKLPKWLNLSLGYSSDLMLGGRENKWTDENNVSYDYTRYDRVRRYYLSVDADLTQIKTKSRFLRGLFFAVNAVKIPAPALEFNNQGKFDFHWLK